LQGRTQAWARVQLGLVEAHFEVDYGSWVGGAIRRVGIA
jgi:hypothetical protein